jgi:hypothetical protein
MDAVYIIGLLTHIMLIAFFIWRAYLNDACRHDRIVIAFCLMYALEFELYRECLRFYGFPQSITDERLLFFRLVYFLLGFYYREVWYYVEKNYFPRQKPRITPH